MTFFFQDTFSATALKLGNVPLSRVIDTLKTNEDIAPQSREIL